MFSYGKKGNTLGHLPLIPQGESEQARIARRALRSCQCEPTDHPIGNIYTAPASMQVECDTARQDRLAYITRRHQWLNRNQACIPVTKGR